MIFFSLKMYFDKMLNIFNYFLLEDLKHLQLLVLWLDEVLSDYKRKLWLPINNFQYSWLKWLHSLLYTPGDRP